MTAMITFKNDKAKIHMKFDVVKGHDLCSDKCNLLVFRH